MYCKNCGKEILEDFGTCPYCKTPIEQNSNNYKDKAWIPYYKRPDSLFKTHPILAWSILVIVLIVGIKFFKMAITETTKLERDWDKQPSTTTTRTY